MRTPEQIRAKFAQLRADCDPRGHDLLDELENACLVDNALLAFNDRLTALEHGLAYSVKVPDFPDRYGHLRAVE